MIFCSSLTCHLRSSIMLSQASCTPGGLLVGSLWVWDVPTGLSMGNASSFQVCALLGPIRIWEHLAHVTESREVSVSMLGKAECILN